MAIPTPYFKYGFEINKDAINNVLLNEASSYENVSSSTLPITTNLYMRFEAVNYNTSTKTWRDSGPSGLNIPITSISGTPYLVKNTYNPNGIINTEISNGAYRTITALKGGVNEVIALGNAQLSSYTLFSIARYGGINKGRIITCASATANWLTGHHDGKAGVAHHNAWITPQSDKYGTDFFINADAVSILYTNGVQQPGGSGTTITYLPPLIINGAEASDWEIIDIIIYNTQLTVEQIRQIESFLESYYGIAATSSSKTIVSALTYNTPLIQTNNYKIGFSSINFTASSSQYVSLPAFYSEASTGLTFAMWFQSNGTTSQGRLFDFGNGSPSSNIAAFIQSNNLGVLVYNTSGSFCKPQNVYSNCNTNTWTHFAWTISADGLTWTIYINGIVQATITSANISSYSNASGGTNPLYPDSGLRSSNYFGKSNWSADPYFTGNLDAFYFFKSCLTSQQITTLYGYSDTTSAINSPSINYNINNKSLIFAPGTIVMYGGSVTTFTKINAALLYNIYSGIYHSDNNLFDTTLNSPYGNSSGTITTISTDGTTINFPSGASNTTRWTIIWTGFFYATTSGTWTFKLTCANGGYLWLGANAIENYTNSNALINNGGTHASVASSKTVVLVGGQYYPIRIMYGNPSANTGSISLSWKLPGSGTEITDGTSYFAQGTYSTNNRLNGWLLCDGSKYNISTYPSLGTAIGKKYGGDGITTFRVPNLMNTMVRGAHAANTNLPIAEGSNTFLLDTNYLPTHTHSANISNDGWAHRHTYGARSVGIDGLSNDNAFADFGDWGDNNWGGDLYTSNDYAGTQNSGSHNHGFAIGTTGGYSPISMKPDSVCVNYIIKT
jgi:microcystin-dependent protein